ncbi:hypothetical protein M5D96_012219 [Drosophila gunungcola]|uniref:Uncharacterized protein n=1 Tax=Drosophila gunungcola TaxID=103775 RepID=A0A9P9YDM6_9MUSC|nr:hypothetical protein M5D96_012219 [Drosophila gunungcola]
MTPFDDFVYLINHVLLGEEPTIEDFILLVGTLVAFIAFILWCCFPIQPKVGSVQTDIPDLSVDNYPFNLYFPLTGAWAPSPVHVQNHPESIKAFDASTSTDDAPNPGGSDSVSGSATGSSTSTSASVSASASNPTQYNGSSGSGSYSKNGTVAMHNYYVKNGHHCCT